MEFAAKLKGAGIRLIADTEKKIIKNTRLLICSILAGGIVILFFSVSVSPLLGDMGMDSPLFMLIGKLLLKGEQLYVDVFDHKGPIIFWINAAGMLLPGTWGIYILESLTLGLTLAYVYKTGALFIIKKSVLLFLMVCYIFMFVYTMREGNSINEYANMIIAAAMYYQMKYYCAGQIQHPYRYAFFYGICFAFIAFMRISNNMFLCGCVLGILCRLIWHKEYQNAGWNILYGLAGICAVVLPISIFYILRDSFMEMIDATFLFNIRYSGYTSTVIQSENRVVLDGILFVSSCVFPMLLPFPQACKEMHLSLLLGGILGAVGVHMGVAYLNYSMIMLPVSFMGLIIACMHKQKYHLTIIAVFLMLVAYYQFGDCNRQRYLVINATRSPYLIQDSLPIPEEEKNQVLGIDMLFFWYLKNDMTPPYKYLGNHTWWSELDDTLRPKMEKFLRGDDAPLWIMIPAMDEYLIDAIHDNYRAVFNDVNYVLYKHK